MWNRITGLLAVLFLCLPFFVHAADEDLWQDYDSYTVIDHDTTWSGHLTHADMPKQTVVVNGATLTILPGTTVEVGILSVYDGRIVAEGTAAEPIHFTKQATDFSNVPTDYAPYDRECYFFPEAGMIEFATSLTADSAPSIFRYATFEGMGASEWVGSDNCPWNMGMRNPIRDWFIQTANAAERTFMESPVLRLDGGRLQLESVSFQNNAHADIESNMYFGNDWDTYDYLQVIDSNFEGNAGDRAVISYMFYDEGMAHNRSGSVLLRNNWYGDASGPTTPGNPGGTGEQLIGDFALDGFSPTKFEAGCTESCYSNVLFLPGLKGSRLYMPDEDGSGEDKLWLPTPFSDDVDDLGLNENGTSKNSVYTKSGDVLGEDPLGGNIYQGFIGKLTQWKTEGTITDYDVFAYDWRFNAEDLVNQGTLYSGNEMRSALDTAIALADSAKSKKVTIIAHSYGGLFAKALMLELESRNLTDKVDKVILVGTPQMGTPLALLSMLYGYDETMGLGALVTKKDARALAEYMPSAYAFLPSKKYLDRIEEAFVTFASERTRYQDFLETYGEKIQDYGEFRDFLLGADGRTDPAKDETELENVLTENLLDAATETHERIDNWTPPASVELIQIAGWGLDTVSGVKYTEKENAQCFPSGKVMSCTGIGEYEPVYEPEFTVDGDKVGVTPSALMLPEADNIKRYWVNLFDQNKGLKIDREHKDFFEVSSLQEFIEGIITNKAYHSSSLPTFIKNSRPDDFSGTAKRLRMSLYSPLDIHLYDEEGNHTGPKTVTIDGQEHVVFEEGIPNSYYLQFGERKYVGFDQSQPIRVEMEGYATGSYTLKLEEVAVTETGESVTAHTTFENLPTTADTAVTFDIPEAGLSEMSDLVADFDGDGTEDYEVEPVPNGTATLEPVDTEAPTTVATLTGTEGENGWYVSDVVVTLAATENEGGSSVEKTEYSLDNGATWLLYGTPLGISGEGTYVVVFASRDTAGNQEVTRSVSIRIDKTSPEAKLQFNPATQELDIVGTDNLSAVSRVDSADSVTLTDQAGHTLVLKFAKQKNKERRIVRNLESLAYDGIVKTVPRTLLRYKWLLDKRGASFKVLAAYLKTEGKKLESHYRPKKDMTIIMTKPKDMDDQDDDNKSDNRPVKEKLPGLVVPGLMTEKGKVKIVY